MHTQASQKCNRLRPHPPSPSLMTRLERPLPDWSPAALLHHGVVRSSSTGGTPSTMLHGLPRRVASRHGRPRLPVVEAGQIQGAERLGDQPSSSRLTGTPHELRVPVWSCARGPETLPYHHPVRHWLRALISSERRARSESERSSHYNRTPQAQGRKVGEMACLAGSKVPQHACPQAWHRAFHQSRP